MTDLNAEAGLSTAIALNDLHEHLLGAHNDLVMFLDTHRDLGLNPALSKDPDYAAVAQLISATADNVRTGRRDLQAALRRKLPTTPYRQLPARTRDRLIDLNGKLTTLGYDLAQWAIHASDGVSWHVQLDKAVYDGGWLDCPRQFYFLIEFARDEASQMDQCPQRWLRFRLPGAKCRYERDDDMRTERPAIRFKEFADQGRWLDIYDNAPIEFEPSELMRVIFECGGVGWAQLAMIRKIRVSFEEWSSHSFSRAV